MPMAGASPTVSREKSSVQRNPTYRTRHRRHAKRDVRAFERGSRRRCTADDPVFVSERHLAVCSDVDEQLESGPVVHACS